jgi:hypothetical protein
MAGMQRIQLELYAERLARQAERLRDDVETARLRIAWAGLERRAREALGSADAVVLDALGVFSGADAAAERRLLERRVRQLGVVERLAAFVEEELAAACADQRGASEARRPPSSS